MALNGDVHVGGQTIVFLAPLTISVAIGATATTPVTKISGMNYLVVEAIFLYGAGGTTANAYVQTSIDGVTWCDIMNFSFTTAAASKVSAVTTNIAPTTQAQAPTDGALGADAVIQGRLGKSLRVKYVTTGTYSGATSLAVYGVAKG